MLNGHVDRFSRICEHSEPEMISSQAPETGHVDRYSRICEHPELEMISSQAPEMILSQAQPEMISPQAWSLSLKHKHCFYASKPHELHQIIYLTIFFPGVLQFLVFPVSSLISLGAHFEHNINILVALIWIPSLLSAFCYWVVDGINNLCMLTIAYQPVLIQVVQILTGIRKYGPNLIVLLLY
jgi:hypothetical protein